MIGGGEKISLSPPIITRRAEFDQLWEVSTPHTLQHTRDGVCVYKGAGNFTHDSIGTVRARHPVDLSSRLEGRSFELRIIEPGQHNYIGMGVVCKTYPVDKLPGWKEISVGYHADNGDLFHSCEDGKPTDYPCMKGDIMRCTVEAVDRGKEVVVRFYRNGEQVGRLTSWKPDQGFYFCFGMMSRDETVQVILPEMSEPYSPEMEATPLEDVWSLTENMEHRGGGVCHYIIGNGDDNVGTIRSKEPLDPFGPNNYFDLKIVDPGEKGYIALGLCSEHYPSNRLPGWDDLSVGFHADDGSIQTSSDQKNTGASCVQGDVIRCSIVPIDKHDKQVDVTFHKNGQFIGKTLFWKPGKGGFYAVIGCMSAGEVIQLASPSLTPSTLAHDHTHSKGIEPPPSLETLPSAVASSLKTGLTSLPSQTESETRVGGADGRQPLSLADVGRGGASINPFFPHHVFHPHHGMAPPFPPPPSFFGRPNAGNVHLYHKIMKWYHAYHYHPHDYHSYPPGEASMREATSLTPEVKANASSPWRYPYPYPPFVDTRSPRAQGVESSRDPPPSMTPDMERQMSQWFEYAKQISVASSASDSAPPGISRENSAEQLSADKESDTQLHQSAGDSNGRRLASSATFNEMTAYDTRSPLTRYISQTSNTSTVSSSSQPHSDDMEDGESQPAPPTGAAYAGTTRVQSKDDPKRSLLKQLPLKDKDIEEDNSTTPVISMGEYVDAMPSCTERNVPQGKEHAATGLTCLVSAPQEKEHAATGLTCLVSAPQEKEHAATGLTCLISAPQEKEHALPVLPTTGRSVFCLQQQDSVMEISKEDNKMFQILHNVDSRDEGSFIRSLSDDDGQAGNSFVMSRLPLSEKLPYFEVEVQELAGSAQSSMAIGLVWQNYPVYHLPGMLPGSIGIHGNGTIIAKACSSGESTHQPITAPLVSGDIIGCQAQLYYKSEVNNTADQKEGNIVKIEFFKNGLSLSAQEVVLPPNGLHPAVGFKGHGTCIRITRNIRLSPNNYFETHTIPRTLVNFTPPTPSTKGWRCLKNATMSEGRRLTIDEPNSGLPAVVQHSLPFSAKNFYFEVELKCHVSALSVLAIGALPLKSTCEASAFIPGEATSSVGFLPLIGFVMRGGVICSAIPEAITSSLSGDNTSIGVGVDFRREVCDLDTSTSGDVPSKDRVFVFFTINGQVVSRLHATLPKGGFYPTLAIDSDSDTVSDIAVAVKFPHLWPKVDNLPYGFVRGVESGFVLSDATTIFDKKGTEGGNVKTLPVRAIQAAAPLSHSDSYFEIQILNGGGTYCISIGLACCSYNLSVHPGWRSESIAFHADDGNLFIDSRHELVAPPCQHKGAVLGCGARFPEDGSTRFAEVYFTVNRRLVVRKFVKVPHLGFFPTVGMRTKGGVITTDLNALDPCPGLKFSTVWSTTENMKIEGDVVTIASNLQRVKRGAALLSAPLSSRQLMYFKVIPLSSVSGTVMVEITTNKECPHNFCESRPFKYWVLNLDTGKVTIHDKYFQSKESCVIKETKEFGFGLEPLPSEKSYLLFFTCDDQVVFCSTIQVDSDEVYPLILMMETSTRLKVDACASWPNTSAIGSGWARFTNLKIENSILTHSMTGQCMKKLPVGFAQSSMPLTPSNPYFEIEVISRAVNKAIAIGLASRRYPSNSWVGWHDESIGYHLDDGKLFKAFKLGHNFGPKAYTCDTVGCGIRFNKVTHCGALKGGDNLEVFFTINGAIIGTQKMVVPCGGAFPTICLESPTESVIYHQHSEVFPPLSRLVDARVWGSAYSVCQEDRQIRHLCRRRENRGGIPKAFCQHKQPFSPDNPYFEMEVVGLDANSIVQLGPSSYIHRGSTSPNTSSVLYSSAGQIVLRKRDQKVVLGTQKSGLGDRLGCGLEYEGDKPTCVNFYVNDIRIVKRALTWDVKLQESLLYPTIILTHPGDTVVPRFNIPPPTSDAPLLVGWLRMERVKVKSALVEYTASGRTMVDVGVAQASHALNFNSITYYEITVIDPGQKCTISIGVAASDYSLNNQPGWRDNSVAVHGDDGRMFQNSGMGTAFGPAWKKYDVIGLGIRSPTNCCMPYSKVQVYFTLNGAELGHTSQVVPPSGLFPTIGMHSEGEKVKVHIGTREATPNSYDVARLQWQALCGIDLKRSGDGRHILSYKDFGRSTPNNLEHGIILSMAIGQRPFSSEEMQYYEVEIISQGHMGVAIGVVPTDFPLQDAPGWSQSSLAYHTDDGALYQSSMKGKDFGPVPHVGDVIGCGVELMPNNTKFCFVFFTYNGFVIGRIRTSLPEKGFHPGLALTGKEDKIAVRFMETFKPKIPDFDSSFIGVMRINNCSYSHQIVQFTGSGISGYTQSPALAQFAIPLHSDRRYFAANIVRSKDVIMIGLAVKDYPMKYAPGFTSISIAYDVLRGSIKAVYGPDNFERLDAPVCKLGDTVGCGIALNQTESKDEAPASVFFTKNGRVVGTVGLVELMEDLYPVVGFIPEEKSSAVFMDWNTPIFEPLNNF